jgi:predicted metal-binding protein
MTENLLNATDTLSKKLVQTCLDAGAYKAYVIVVEKIPFDKDLRVYCEANYCGNYGCNYACPPYVGTADELVEKARKFKHALVFQTVKGLEDSYDFEGMTEAAKQHAENAMTISGSLTECVGPFLQLTAGGCNLCEICAQKTGEPCRFPCDAISSLEAYCINVSTLAGLCDMKYINGTNTVTYFGAFLYDEHQEEIGT